MLLRPIALLFTAAGLFAAGGIQPITMELRDKAIRCGEAGAHCAIAPYRLASPETQPFSAWIATPYSRVAFSVFEALRLKQPPRPMEPGAANGWGVGIYVSPAEDYARGDSIRRVVIERAGRAIEPETTTLAPVTLVNAAGEKKQVSKGFFAFPLETFAPTADITIVLMGSAGEIRCPLSRRKLAALK